jgi:CheY-like chemotaxis protein
LGSYLGHDTVTGRDNVPPELTTKPLNSAGPVTKVEVPADRGPWYRSILLVADEAMVGLVLEGMAREFGYSFVSWARTPGEALEQLSDVPLPEFALVDLRLGSETADDVLDACEQLRLPGLITTGYSSGDVPDRYLQHPLAHKPFTLEQLQPAIAALRSQAHGNNPDPDLCSCSVIMGRLTFRRG